METVNIYFKKLSTDAKIPEYHSREAAGFDFASIEDFSIEPSSIHIVKTGLAVEIPDGYELQVRPRSGLALKHGITVLNTPGTVDSDYRGELNVILINLGKNTIRFHKGERIAQGVINKLPKVNIKEKQELSTTERGTNGFGSTGIN